MSADGRFIEESDFRTLAAPGLDEDELYVALHGLPGQGALWGEGRAARLPPADLPWEVDRARRTRHASLLAKWDRVREDERDG